MWKPSIGALSAARWKDQDEYDHGRRLGFITDDDHQAEREVTRRLDTATLRQVTHWLERTRAAALALRGTGQIPPPRLAARRGRI
ncbi:MULTISPECIES: hypothetical protein [Kitasatospora]|uniref:Uncharacterized protein n=1 Tax=Kitasatospora cystarginea TaxID=58350 RepID=A0ABN3EZG0_9ACTN